MSGEQNNIETYNIHGIGQGSQVYSKIVGSQSYRTLTKKLTDRINGLKIGNFQFQTMDHQMIEKWRSEWLQNYYL